MVCAISHIFRRSISSSLCHFCIDSLQTAMEESVDFRQGLPINYLSHLGVAHSDSDTPMRREFMERIRQLMGRLFDFAPVDAAADQMGKRFVRDSLPPYLTPDESNR